MALVRPPGRHWAPMIWADETARRDGRKINLAHHCASGRASRLCPAPLPPVVRYAGPQASNQPPAARLDRKAWSRWVGAGRRRMFGARISVLQMPDARRIAIGFIPGMDGPGEAV